MLLNYLRCHVQRSTANCSVNLRLVFELLREAKVGNLDFEVNFVEVYVSEPLSAFFFGQTDKGL